MQAQGNLSEAIEYYKKYSSLKDSLYNSEKTEQLSRWEAFYNIETKEKENQALKAEKIQQALLIRNQWITNLAVGIVSLLLVIILIIIFRAYQISKKSSKTLKEKNQEITHTNHQLAEIDKVKNKLFSIIAHDLRGPIVSLNQFLKLLKENTLTKDEFRSILNKLQAQSENTEDLVENLLFWAKNQMEGIIPKFKKVNAEDIIQEVFNLYQATAIQKDIELNLQSSTSSQVYADRDMLKLIIRNLVNNAIKYSYQNSTIHVKIDKDSSSNNVIISIKDKGIGIPLELQEQLFSVNIQSRRGTKQEKGTGLGLLLVKDFVEAMHGKLSVQSEANQGTSFFLHLPSPPIDADK
ncbi:MAG: HAMP domain-containing histidine kinase [Microscillaceae bacterium]|nr:HAMP domain-containing histidine kinase [Microscillaceae bacterium]